MKAKIIGSNREIEMPAFFGMQLREDIAQKLLETEKRQQPYGPNSEAGKHHSASGNLSHSRRLWKTAYGKGISRVPRKIMWRRGDHFYWIGAEVSGTRGGRRAQPPIPLHFQTRKKINKKEALIGLQSALAATARIEMVKSRYQSLQDLKITLPLVVSSDVLKMKVKDFYNFLEKNLADAFPVCLKKKEIRAGKGKKRNRRYKENAGLLFVVGKDEGAKFQGIDLKKLEDVELGDLWPLGRLTIYTENAIKQLSEVKEK